MLTNLFYMLGLVFILICIVSLIIITIFYYQTRKRTAQYYDNPDLQLHYFIQKQVDYQNKVIGYECLLRQRDSDGAWRLPKEMAGMPLQRALQLLEETFNDLPETPYQLSINLSHEQIASREFPLFVRWAVSKIEPMTLVVDYRPKANLTWFQKQRFLHNIKLAKSANMKLAIDNVDTTFKTLKTMEHLIPVASIIKCSMAAFRKDDESQWLDLNLQFWNRLAQDHQLELILTGIETEADAALAQQLQIKFRQGYLIGRPAKTVMPTEA
ncbi:EAL domain-containing protein [uncultured Secundilactobacillus sp.]|uniref:EAL domain-containing protein n=1 Tax=uncultured Secundilactobacillus sp. TaxID=2813935 RepID=UPI0025832D41|nr:EAL domain-containing protein [uncultured Secundilactobacillus sp.]